MQITYQEKLKNPRWQKKRLEILERDNWTCQICHDDETTLVVHHRCYMPDKEPWDYPDHLLITLCEDCHENEREIRGEYEDNLLEILREKFFADDISILTMGFLRLQLQRDSLTVAKAYGEALASSELQTDLLSKRNSRDK